MARMTLTSTVGSGLEASYGRSSQPDATAFEAALATLVTDGASPTQAHVTAANNAYTTLKAAYTAYYGNDVILSVNGGAVLTKNKYREIIRALEQLVFGSSLLTGA